MARRARTRIARRLGGRDVRRRRHRRVALAVVLVSVLAGVLVVAGSGSDDGTGEEDVAAGDDPITLVCRASNEELATAQRALLGDNDAPGAAEGFLADAFVDLARSRAAAIRATEPAPAPEVLDVLAEFDEVIVAIEADPSIGLTTDPFAAVDVRWQDLGLDECAIGAGTVADE